MTNAVESDAVQLRDIILEQAQAKPEAPRTVRFGSLPPKMPIHSEDPLLSRVSPLLELLYLFQIKAGHPSASEEAVLRGVARILTTDLDHSHVTALMERYKLQVEEQGLEARFDHVTGLLANERINAEAAYLLARTVALANGDISPEEADLLHVVASSMGISVKRTRELEGSR